jgi:mono/diheme cytochrome c family protein
MSAPISIFAALAVNESPGSGRRRVSPLAILCLALVLPLVGAACLQKLDTGADDGTMAPPPDPSQAPPLLDPDYPVEYGSAGATTDDPCVATKTQSLEIRQTFCGVCHGPDGTQGQPLFNFVLDDDKLLGTVDPATQLPFVAAGDPERSRLYQRVALGTMPPGASDVANQATAAPSTSDISVLRQWILCLGGSGPTDRGSDDADGGAAGSGDGGVTP